MSRLYEKLVSSLSRRAKDTPLPVRNDTLAVASSALLANPDKSQDRHYIVQVREKFHDNRYEAIKQLGQGTYSRVWLARDLRRDTYVALKILSNDCYGSEHDIFEIEILEAITREQKQLSESRGSHVLGLLDKFQLTGPNGKHECIALPVVGCSLDAQARRFAQRRIPVEVMKHITRQILVGLAFLHERCKVIHSGKIASSIPEEILERLTIVDTDLQPSNICFDLNEQQIEDIARGQDTDQVTPISAGDAPGNVRIIDLGVASWIDKHLSDNVQPEHLRAPEVILGAPWGPPIDIWSLGCLVIEFVKGHVAFPGVAREGSWTSSDDHLAQYMEVLGPMPPELLKRSTKAHEYFNEKGALLRIPTLKWTNLREFVDGQHGPFQRPPDMSAEEALAFVDFLQCALALDPQCRKTAHELLDHEWLRDTAERPDHAAVVSA